MILGFKREDEAYAYDAKDTVNGKRLSDDDE